MPFDQRLTLKYDRDTFGWTKKSKSLLLQSDSRKNIDFQNVNVVETCDELLAMQSDSGGCVESPQTKMRTYLNLCYGTLKIFEHQVNILLEMSQDLASLTGSYEVKSLTVTKRKSSCKVQTIVSKKARFSKTTRKITKITQDLTETNYSSLLDEWEKWVISGSERTQFGVGANNLEPQIDANITHIKEITTIRETYTEFDLPELDGDLEFGNATPEELNAFLLDDTLEKAETNKPMKPKLTLDYNLNGKMCKLNDGSFFLQDDWLTEAARYADTSTSLVAYYDDDGSTVKRAEQQPASEHSIDDHTLIHEKEATSSKDIVSLIQGLSISEGRAKKRQSKIIVDKCLMIDTSKMLAQLENGTSAFNRIQNCTKKTPYTILNQLNRRSITEIHLKLKRKFTKVNSSNEYLNILSDILGHTVHNDLAIEIYPKWNEKPQHKSNNNNRISELNSNLIETDQIDLMPTPPSSKETSLDFNADATTDVPLPNEWSVQGVKTKLINMWREAGDTEINAKRFCMSAKNHIDAALAFSSLLTLSAKNLIVITKNGGDSIEMKTILLSENLLKDLK